MQNKKHFLDISEEVEPSAKVPRNEETCPYPIFQIPFPKSTARPCLTKVISGGQTGADRAGLEAARDLGLKTGGWAPHNFMTSKGKAPELKSLFHLKRMPEATYSTATQSYVERSKRNVDDADATLFFKIRDSVGTDKTLGYALTGTWKLPCARATSYKPHLIITDSVNPIYEDGAAQLAFPSRTWLLDAEALYNFLVKHRVKTLNVAGHSQNDKIDPTWQTRVYNFLLFALQRMKVERVALDTEAASEVPAPEQSVPGSSN